MTNDDDMREIEAALDKFYQASAYMDTQWIPERDKLLALIRAKLDARSVATDAEHERAVEAWRDSSNEFTVCTGGYECSGEQHARWSAVRYEALRLMRARPATCKDGLQVQRDKAAAELLRAADELLRDTTPTNRDCFAVCNYVVDDLRNAIEAAKRARPASGKDEAAGELLRAAKEAWPWVYGHPKQSDELWQAIAKAERAGIK